MGSHTHCGADLLKMFTNLNVEVGNLNENLFSAWFDSDYSERHSFLRWACSLNDSNIVKPLEKIENEELTKRNLFMLEDELERHISKMSDLLNIDDNLLEAEILKAEFDLLSEEERHLQHVMSVNEELHKELIKELRKSGDAETSWSAKRERSFLHCCHYAKEHDKTNIELQQATVRYGQVLCNLDSPLFLSNTNVDVFDGYCDTFVSVLNNIRTDVTKIEVSSLDKFNNTSVCKLDATMDDVFMLRDRIVRSTQRYLFTRVDLDKLRELIGGYASSRRIIHELDIETMARETADMYIYGPKCNLAKRNLKVTAMKLKHLNKITSTMNRLLACKSWLQKLHEIEQNDVMNTDGLFRKILHYITHDLHNCKLRCNAMLEVINEHCVYKQQPIEARNPFIKTVAMALSDGHLKKGSLHSALMFREKLKRDKERVDAQVYVESFQKHRHMCRKLEMSVCTMKTFLRSGPTTNFFVVPHEFVCMFRKMNNLLEQQKKDVMAAVQVPQKANKKISDNKWYRLRRLLWIYFLTDPIRLLASIEEIKSEVKEQIRQNMGF